MRTNISSMPYKPTSAELVPPWGPFSFDVSTCDVSTRYNCWSGCSRPSCSLVPCTLVKSGRQLMQPLSRFGSSGLFVYSTSSIAVLAMSRAMSQLLLSLRSFLRPGDVIFGSIGFSVSGMQWLKLNQHQSVTLSNVMPLLWLRMGAALAGLYRSSDALLSMASPARWWPVRLLKYSLMSRYWFFKCSRWSPLMLYP